MAYPGEIDWKNPDYTKVFAHRMDMLRRMRTTPGSVRLMKAYYKENPIDFIEDWGVTFDPRAVELRRPALMPFVLFPKQKEWLQWVIDCWRDRENGLSDKSRDMGLTWCAAALSCTLGLFNDGFVAGFGSRKEELVDSAGDPDSIFFKVRMFMAHLPKEFRGNWNEKNFQHSRHRFVMIPDTGSVVRGEGGDNIGRGGRAAIYFVDESAHLPRPQLVETALSFTTNCRIDISSVNGTDNPFAEKRFSGRVRVMTMHWRDDPRKGQAWYDKQTAKFNPLVIAQEVDIDYSASKEGVLIPPKWVQACIDADVALGLKITGDVSAALDVADEGVDLNSYASKRGVKLMNLVSWSGQKSNIYKTTVKTHDLASGDGAEEFYFDSDGLGVGVRGDSEAINKDPERKNHPKVNAIPWRGSGGVVNPTEVVYESVNGNKKLTNEDFFANRKAQGWWHLRTLAENTYKAVVEKLVVDLDQILVIPSSLPNRVPLVAQLSQPTYSINNAGKILVDKDPEGMASPNEADSVMILYSPKNERKSYWD